MPAELRIAIPVPTTHDLEYNRRSWPMYATAVQEAGGTPVKVDLSLGLSELVQLVRGCDGILLPGSPADVDPRRYGQERLATTAAADPAREETDRLLLEEAFASEKPVLGICYGVQSMNVWRGGTLVQDLPALPVNHEAGSAVAVAHTAVVASGSRLSALVDQREATAGSEGMRLPINSSHHQAIERLGEGLRLVAVSTQDGVVEAIEGSDATAGPRFVLGVQWHPERSVAISATSRAIFGGLVEAARVRRQELAGREG